MSAEGLPPQATRAAPAPAARGQPVAVTLRARLAALDPVVLELDDDSAEHAGHSGAAAGGGHFSLLIVSDHFSGMSRLARHRAVLDRVADLIPHPVHALAIRAYTPDEFPS
jgi:BolA protein